MKVALCFSFWTTLLLMMTQGAFGQLTNTWTGADPSGYWSAPANWSPAGVPVNGNDLVFPGGLAPGDMVSTNDLTDSFFRSIKFVQASSRHTIRGNPITLTNGADCIINCGTNVIACDLTFSGTPSTSSYQIRGFPGELTMIGNVGGSSLYVFIDRLVIRGQFAGGSIRMQYGSLALYGDNPHAVSVEVYGSSGSTLRVQGSQPNLNITMLWEMESASCPNLTGDGVVGDVTGCGHITPDSTLSVKNLGHYGGWGGLDIRLNGTNVGEYGRLVASGDVSLSSGSLLPSPGFNPQAGQIFTIVEKTSPGPITNAFLGSEGTVTTLNGMPFRISYVGGDGNDVTLTAQPTNTPPVVTWISPANGATFQPGATISLQARATNAVSFVEFFADSTNLGRGVLTSNNIYQLVWSNAPAGTFQMHAEAENNLGARGVSGSVQITVAGGTATPTFTWTGADPSGYWSASANWSPAGVPASGADLVFPSGLPPEDKVSTNDLTDSIFRSITFDQAGGHTIRGNSMTLTNGIGNSGTNVIACDLILPASTRYGYPRISGPYRSGELTVTGNVGSGLFYVFGTRLVIRGQLSGGSLFADSGATVAFYGDNPQAAFSADFKGGGSLALVHGSQPNLNLRGLVEMEDLSYPKLSGDGAVGDVTGFSYITPDSTLSVKNVSVYTLDIYLNGPNVGEYGRLVGSGDMYLSRGRFFPSAGFNPQAGQVYTIVEKTSPGAITNAFLGPEGTITYINGMPVRLSYVGGDGNEVTLTVEATNIPPSVTITNPPGGAVFAAPASFSLEASASDPDGSVTDVQFFRGATSLGNDSSSPYSASVSGLAAGNYTFSAVASDNRGLRATNFIAVTVNPSNNPPTVSISPSNGAVLAAPFSGTIRANAVDSDGTVARVDFFSDGSLVGSDSSAPFDLAVTNIAPSGLSAGTYALHAVATDDRGATNRSATATVTVVTPVPIVLSDIQHIQRSYDTQLVFSYSVNVGLRYAVERTATWSNWTTIWSETANVNPMTVADSTVTNRMNFYRVRRLPNPP